MNNIYNKKSAQCSETKIELESNLKHWIKKKFANAIKSCWVKFHEVIILQSSDNQNNDTENLPHQNILKKKKTHKTSQIKIALRTMQVTNLYNLFCIYIHIYILVELPGFI